MASPSPFQREGWLLLKQVTALLPTSSCSLEVAICRSPSGVALTWDPAARHLRPHGERGDDQAHRLPPQKEAVSFLRTCEKSLSFDFWFGHQPGGALSLAPPLGAVVSPPHWGERLAWDALNSFPSLRLPPSFQSSKPSPLLTLQAQLWAFRAPHQILEILSFGSSKVRVFGDEIFTE